MTDGRQTQPIDKGHEEAVTLYTEGFKKRMVKKLTGPHAKTATALSSEAGVSQPTLSRWLRETGMVTRAMSSPDDAKLAVAPTKRPQDWTAEEKWALVLEATTVPEAELGALLRRRGVHEAQLVEWRAAALAGLQRPSRGERKAVHR